MAFVFTQCGLSYALRPEQGRGGEQVAKAIGASASATGTVQIPKAVDVKKHIMNMLRTYGSFAFSVRILGLIIHNAGEFSTKSIQHPCSHKPFV